MLDKFLIEKDLDIRSSKTDAKKYVGQKEQKEYHTGNSNNKPRKRSQRRTYTQNNTYRKIRNKTETDQKNEVVDIAMQQTGLLTIKTRTENQNVKIAKRKDTFWKPANSNTANDKKIKNYATRRHRGKRHRQVDKYNIRSKTRERPKTI